MSQTLKENRLSYIQEYYLPTFSQFPGMTKYEDVCGWTDYYLQEHVLFSRRRVFYDRASFPDKLHSHGFFEIDIFLDGTVSYVSGSRVFSPQYGDIMVFPPECEHTVRSNRDGIYDRVVLYVDPEWFSNVSGGWLPGIFRETEAGCYMIPRENSRKFLDHLGRLEQCITAEQSDSALLACGYLALLLALIGNSAIPNFGSICRIPQRLVEIKEYLDANYAGIPTVDALASRFYYSREHLCRLFKDYYKITLSEYLHRKKVERARQALDLNSTVSYAFDISGFQSYSAFVKAFREIVGVNPGKYRAASGKSPAPPGKSSSPKV